MRITASRLEPTLAELGLFKQVELLKPPTISDRDTNGMVAITGGNGLKIVYTTDGSMPTVKSDVYQSPIDLSNGGTVNAALVGVDGRIGMIGTTYASGYPPRTGR